MRIARQIESIREAEQNIRSNQLTIMWIIEKEISPEEMIAYMERHGWRKTSVSNNESYGLYREMQKTVNGEPYFVFVPMERHRQGYAETMYKAYHTFSILERKFRGEE